VTVVRIAVDINAPPQRVLAVLFDVERWPEWTSTVTQVQRLDRGPFGVGSSARVVWQVTELDENRSFTWVTHAPGARITAGHFVEAQGDGSRAALSFEIAGWLGPIVSRLYRGMIQQYVATEASGLKQRSES
jgi:uncharacterized membrane protein